MIMHRVWRGILVSSLGFWVLCPIWIGLVAGLLGQTLPSALIVIAGVALYLVWSFARLNLAPVSASALFRHATEREYEEIARMAAALPGAMIGSLALTEAATLLLPGIISGALVAPVFCFYAMIIMGLSIRGKTPRRVFVLAAGYGGLATLPGFCLLLF